MRSIRFHPSFLRQSTEIALLNGMFLHVIYTCVCKYCFGVMSSTLVPWLCFIRNHYHAGNASPMLVPLWGEAIGNLWIPIKNCHLSWPLRVFLPLPGTHTGVTKHLRHCGAQVIWLCWFLLPTGSPRLTSWTMGLTMALSIAPGIGRVQWRASWTGYGSIKRMLCVLVTHPSFPYPGLILSLRPTNERRRYKVTPSLIGWTQI